MWPTALIAVCLLSVWRGGDDERLAAGAYLMNWAITRVVYRAGTEQTQWAVLAVDLALLGVLVWLALRSRRYWPLFAAGFHLLAVVTHLARAADPRVSGWAYITAEIFWSYLVIFAIGYGAWTAPRQPADAPTESGAPPGDTRL